MIDQYPIAYRKSLELRFWSKVKKTETCWLWIAATNIGGYGFFSVGGRRSGRMVAAHRISYELTYGTFNEELFVLHKCDNPPCVRPEHLFLGDNYDNVLDAIKKGRKKFTFNAAHQFSRSV